jgi:hypothetical protein
MSISQDKFWKPLMGKRVGRAALKEVSCISFYVPAKMGKSAAVSRESMRKALKSVDCCVSDVVEIEKEDMICGVGIKGACYIFSLMFSRALHLCW